MRTEPLMTERRVQTICLLLLATIATGAALQALSDVMIPFALALFSSIALAPVVDFLSAKTRLSRGVSVGITMLLGGLLLAVLSGVVAVSLDELRPAAESTAAESTAEEGVERGSDSIDIDAVISDTLAPMERWLPEGAAATVTDGVKALVPKLVGLLGSFLSQGVTVLIFLMFLLVEQNRSRVRRDKVEVGESVAGAVEKRVKKYISVKVLTSAVTGVSVGVALAAIGTPAAELFGLLTFMLNFIPTIGSVIAVLLPLPVLYAGDASYLALGAALLIPGGIQFAAGQIWENKLLGDAFDLRPSVVLLGLVFWGKIWGIVGMLLATPILAVLKTLMEGSEITRPLAKVMGQSGPPVEVCAAVVVDAKGAILVARRTRPAEVAGLWEFPGGKLEEDESPGECLVREFQEELGFVILVGDRLGSAIQEGPDRTLRLTAFAATPAVAGAEARPLDGTHDEVRWVTREELEGMAARKELAPLDIPLVAKIPVPPATA